MSVIFILLILSLVIGGGFLTAFLLSVRSGQFDDTHTPALRVLIEDDMTSDKTTTPIVQEENT